MPWLQERGLKEVLQNRVFRVMALAKSGMRKNRPCHGMIRVGYCMCPCICHVSELATNFASFSKQSSLSTRSLIGRPQSIYQVCHTACSKGPPPNSNAWLASHSSSILAHTPKSIKLGCFSRETNRTTERPNFQVL